MKSVCLLLQGHYEVDIRVRRKAEALVAAGYRVDVLALRSTFSNAEHYTLAGVHVHTISIGKERGSLFRYIFEYSAFFVWAALKLPALMKRHRFAVIDVNTLPDFLIFAACTARWTGAKLILDMHEIMPEFFVSKYGVDQRSSLVRILKRLERASMRYADRVIVINQPIQALLESRGLERSQSTIVMNSADELLFVSDPGSSHSPPSASSESGFIFMYHGTLTRIYGLDLAIEAFALARPRMPGSEYWIIGGGPERAALEQLVSSLNLESCVKFIGTVLPDEIPRWLQRASAGVLSTRQDVFLDYSFSNKLSEYIISRKPVIASRLKTINHYFSNNALAYFSPGDPGDLADKMIRIYQDETLRTRMIEAAEHEYSPLRWDIMKARYVGVVDQLANEGSSSRAR